MANPVEKEFEQRSKSVSFCLDWSVSFKQTLSICWHLQKFHKYFWLDCRRTPLPSTLDIRTRCIGNSWWKQECIPVGCVPPASVVAGAGGFYRGSVCSGRGCLLTYRGCLPGGVHPLPFACWDTHTPSPLHAMIHPREQNDWQTGVKTLLFQNFVCGR